MATQPIAEGKVESLCINGAPVQQIDFDLNGPRNDVHTGHFSRRLSGHDSEYIRTSSLKKGSYVFNWRSWTGLSQEDVAEIQHELGVTIPQGCLLENIIVSGIPHFSRLEPTTRLIFPFRENFPEGEQAILTIWEQNGPCRTVGDRLAKFYGRHELMAKFVAAAKNRRGVMGFVLAAGLVRVGDTVLVYPPAS